MSKDQKTEDAVKVEIVKKAWYKRWWGITLIAFFALVVIGSFASEDEGTDTASQEPSNSQATEASQQDTADEAEETSPEKTEKKSYGVGDDVQVGEVKWKVLTAPTKTKEIGSEYSKETAGGIFVIVELQAELTGKESGEVSSAQFAILDSQDRKFEASSDASMGLVMDDKETFSFTQVNPNVPITGFVGFDIPEDATGLKLQIDDLRTFSDEHELVDLGI